MGKEKETDFVSLNMIIHCGSQSLIETTNNVQCQLLFEFKDVICRHALIVCERKTIERPNKIYCKGGVRMSGENIFT